MAEGKASEKSDTQKNTSAQSPCRVPQPRCTKCTKTSLGFLVVWLSPQKRYGRRRYKHTRAWARRAKYERDMKLPFLWSTHHSNRRKSKEWVQKSNKHQQAKGSTHISLDRWGLRAREEEEWNPHPFNQLVMERMKAERKETWSHDPNQLIRHHNHATKRHKAIPTAHSDAVVIARSEEMPM
jgi:hypothetical protein